MCITSVEKPVGTAPGFPDAAYGGEPPLMLFVQRGAVISLTFTPQPYQRAAVDQPSP